jgi:alkylation response protein AidB-like acyl-CoA dehydrogenase
MDFTFTEDQLLFQDEVKKFLVNEVTPEKIRELWETETGRSDALWQALAGMGLTGLTVPEEFGGMGMNAVDFVLLAQECGFVALPEPLVETVLVAVPLINALPSSLAGSRALHLAKPGLQWAFRKTFSLPMHILPTCCCCRMATRSMPSPKARCN